MPGTPISGPAAGIYLSSLAGGLISGNVTHDNSAHGIYLTGSTTGVTVQGNTSYHNAYQYERNANGIDDIAPGNFIIGNVTYANEDTGINIYTGGNNTLVADNVTYDNGDHGIDDFNVTGGRIIGNTVYFNCTDGINVEGTSGNYDIENNVSMNNATGAIINPTPIAINPSTGAVLHEPLQPADREHRRLRLRAGHDDGQLQPGLAERTRRRVHLGGNRVQHPGRAERGHRAGGERHLRQPAVRQCRGVEPPADRGIPGHRLGQLRRLRRAGHRHPGQPRVDDPATPNTGNPAGSYYDRGAYEYQPGRH